MVAVVLASTFMVMFWVLATGAVLSVLLTIALLAV